MTGAVPLQAENEDWSSLSVSHSPCLSEICENTARRVTICKARGGPSPRAQPC